MFIRMQWLMLAVIPLAACDGVGAIGETESAILQGRRLASWGTVDGPDLDLGDATNRTCFLAGVAGNLAGFPVYPGHAARAGFFIDPNTLRYSLSARSGWNANGVSEGAPVNAHGVCIYETGNRKIIGWQSDYSGKSFLGAKTANRQCFLQNVTANGNFTSSSDGVFITVDNSGWWIDGTVHSTPQGLPATATAVCVDIPNITYAIVGQQGAPDPGTLINGTVAQDDGHVVCGLRGIWGHFNANDWNDGAMLTWPSSIPGPWSLVLTNGKTASLACVN